MLLLLAAMLSSAQAATYSSITTDTCTTGSGDPAYVIPLPSEDGRYLGHRFGPFTSATSISALTFTMIGSGAFDPECDSLLTPVVRVWSQTTSGWPVSLPMVTIATSSSQIGATPLRSSNNYTVYTTLASSLSVKAGSYVFVTIEMQNNSAGAICVSACKDGNPMTYSVVSDADVAPLGWDPLSMFGIDYDRLRITLHGT